MDIIACRERVAMAYDRINFHHLHYFWAVARDGNLTRTAAALRISQSALSAQIRQLEDQLGEPLFLREERKLKLTEAGAIVLEYADEIFARGSELLATLKLGLGRRQRLRMGAVSTLSRNFQESFLRPLLQQADVRLTLRAGELDELLVRLAHHELELVLSNRLPVGRSGEPWRCRRIARQPLSLVGHGRRGGFRFPDDLDGLPVIVPGPESEIRMEFEALCAREEVRVRVLAEVDDMATMRLLARDTDAVAVLPAVVVRDELQSGTLHEYATLPGLFENFYCVTVERHYTHPIVRALLTRDEHDILEM
jgi:LysR family transcriptional activator of nhaA